MTLSSDCCRGIDWHIANAILLYRIERDIPKDRIFEIYLNEVGMGRSTRGVAEAARAYFDKPLSDLTIEEAAYLAAIPRAPFTIDRDTETGMRRRNAVLDRMTETGAITAVQAEAAKQMPLRHRERAAPI